jgi:hypothetical protein
MPVIVGVGFVGVFDAGVFVELEDELLLVGELLDFEFDEVVLPDWLVGVVVPVLVLFEVLLGCLGLLLCVRCWADELLSVVLLTGLLLRSIGAA